MQPTEVQIHLTDIMLQELVWRALLPEASVRKPVFNEAVQQHMARAGLSPQYPVWAPPAFTNHEANSRDAQFHLPRYSSG